MRGYQHYLCIKDTDGVLEDHHYRWGPPSDPDVRLGLPVVGARNPGVTHTMDLEDLDEKYWVLCHQISDFEDATRDT